MEFEVTILTAQDLKARSVSKSLVILLMFGVMWGVGLFGLLLCVFRRQYRRFKIQEFESKKIQGATRSRIDDLSPLLMKYLDEVFPIVYQNRSYAGRMLEEILKHHRYLDVLSNRSGVDSKRVITCVHLLTIQTLLMFLLAVFYELQVKLYLPSSNY